MSVSAIWRLLESLGGFGGARASEVHLLLDEEDGGLLIFNLLIELGVKICKDQSLLL